MKTIDDIIMEQLSSLPPLPEGWTYDFSFERVYDGKMKVWRYEVTATPVQRFAAGGGRGSKSLER